MDKRSAAEGRERESSSQKTFRRFHRPPFRSPPRTMSTTLCPPIRQRTDSPWRTSAFSVSALAMSNERLGDERREPAGAVRHGQAKRGRRPRTGKFESKDV